MPKTMPKTMPKPIFNQGLIYGQMQRHGMAIANLKAAKQSFHKLGDEAAVLRSQQWIERLQTMPSKAQTIRVETGLV